MPECRLVVLCFTLCTWLIGAQTEEPIVFVPDTFECETNSCSMFEFAEWYPVRFRNSSTAATTVLLNAMADFGVSAPVTCRKAATSGIPYDSCTKDYCNMYEQIAQNLTFDGGPGYYGGEWVKPLLNFNRTLCETVYRDTQAFCGCLCPAMPLLQASSGGPKDCLTQIMAFLLLGRRGDLLAGNYSVDSYCASALCKWFSVIGDPNPPTPVSGVPDKCHSIYLPFLRGQCERMMAETPFNPTPWLNPKKQETPNTMECTDTTLFDVDLRAADTWAACNRHQFRWSCPAVKPIMCEGRLCEGMMDYCCEAKVQQCPLGPRRVSLALDLNLQEWRGKLPPEMYAQRVQDFFISTPSPLQAALIAASVTTARPGTAQEFKRTAPIIFGSVGGFCFVGLLLAFYVLGRRHATRMSTIAMGLVKAMLNYNSSPVSIWIASGNVVRRKGEEELPIPPVVIPPEVILEQRLDFEACEALQDCTAAAEKLGFKHLAPHPFSGHGEPAQAAFLRAAIAEVRLRNLQNKGENAELIKKGEKWLRVLEVETEVVRAIEAATDDLETCWQPTGSVWMTSTLGKTMDNAVAAERVRRWRRIEDLADAIKVAKTEGGSVLLLNQATPLLRELVAKTHELPSSRCILDPEGEGVKLLPKGSQRAVYVLNGEGYTYDSNTDQAGDLNDPPPPREFLGIPDQEFSKPVCASFAKKGSCPAGKLCPWRHCKPKVGDVVKEFIERIEREPDV